MAKAKGAKVKEGGGGDRKPDKDKNANPSGGNPHPTPGGNPEPSGGQPNTAFASDKQHVLDLYCSKGKHCCYKFYWPYFGIACGNPRFCALGKVLTKGALERSRMVLCSLNWGGHGGNEYWRTSLDKLTLNSIQLPDDAIYVSLGSKTPIRKAWLG